ncbi:Xylanase inhibitor protein 1 [Dichanthelium oligosanthes]|uniref:Xylanase inhibitor protein 1 n=1 Tax=Dichanthelium oligosanthes TaxID=888268 RepID=A0A1E5VJC6_9POAL|nr:Xylanase inhibitor protein 1 [Dichanthelium oligosanthes]
MDKLFSLIQPDANNQCGFYAMWAMHRYTGDNFSAAHKLQREELTRELLEFEIIGMQEQLAGFIMDEAPRELAVVVLLHRAVIVDVVQVDAVAEWPVHAPWVSLAIGCFGGSYSLPTKQSALDLSDYLWNAYLGGSKQGVSRPFGDAWLDGVDLFLEHGSPSEHYKVLAKELAARNVCGRGPAGNKPLHLTATPHCAIPDRFVKRALATGVFERIHVRFYDDEDCSIFFERQWTAAYPASRVFYGLLASEEQSETYWIYPKDLYYGVIPVIQRAANYGGVMILECPSIL